MGFLTECFELFRNWIAVDRIRLPKHTGRLGGLRVGDRFLHGDSIFVVVSVEILISHESRAQKRLTLIDTGVSPLTHWELVILSTSQPTISVVGNLRRENDDKSPGQSINDLDVVILKPSENENNGPTNLSCVHG